MKQIFIILLFVSTLFAGRYQTELNNLDIHQKNVLTSALKVGKDYDLSYTLAAIAWRESLFGLKKTNHKDGIKGSYGTYQIQLYYALEILELEHTKQNEEMLRFYLINSEDISAKYAIFMLMEWYRIHKDYDKMLASYNVGGISTKSANGQRYVRDIKYRIKLLKKYVAENNIKY